LRPSSASWTTSSAGAPGRWSHAGARSSATNWPGGTLELRVAGPAALLVQHQSADILARVNLFLGPGAVEKLRIAQGPVKPLAMPAASTKGARRRFEPLDAASEAELAKSVEAAPDALKSALATLGRAVMADQAKGRNGRR
jgi:hypothetical protein